jgi:hypothetical protein
VEFSIKQWDIEIGVRCGSPGHRRNWKIMWDKEDRFYMVYILGWRFGARVNPFYLVLKGL